MALAGGLLAEHFGVVSILLPLSVVQGLAVIAALMIHEDQTRPVSAQSTDLLTERSASATTAGLGLKDRSLWVFVSAMVLFHIANAPAGVYLGLFLKGDLHAADGFLSWAFVVSMIAWMLVVRPAGWLADRLGRRPLLIVGWCAMTIRLVLIAMAQAPWQILAVQVLDGLAQGIFIVLAAAWVTDRLADHKRIGEAQALVGSALVAGSAIGPILSGLIVEAIGYRGMFWMLAGVGTFATLIVVLAVPETLRSTKSKSLA